MIRTPKFSGKFWDILNPYLILLVFGSQNWWLEYSSFSLRLIFRTALPLGPHLQNSLLEPETHSLPTRTYSINIYLQGSSPLGVFQPFDFPSFKACAAASAGNDTVTFIRWHRRLPSRLLRMKKALHPGISTWNLKMMVWSLDDDFPFPLGGFWSGSKRSFSRGFGKAGALKEYLLQARKTL